MSKCISMCEYFNFRLIVELIILTREAIVYRGKDERRMYRVGRPTVVLSFPLDKRAFLVSPRCCYPGAVSRNANMSHKEYSYDGER